MHECFVHIALTIVGRESEATKAFFMLNILHHLICQSVQKPITMSHRSPKHFSTDLKQLNGIRYRVRRTPDVASSRLL